MLLAWFAQPGGSLLGSVRLSTAFGILMYLWDACHGRASASPKDWFINTYISASLSLLLLQSCRGYITHLQAFSSYSEVLE